MEKTSEIEIVDTVETDSELAGIVKAVSVLHETDSDIMYIDLLLVNNLGCSCTIAIKTIIDILDTNTGFHVLENMSDLQNYLLTKTINNIRGAIAIDSFRDDIAELIKMKDTSVEVDTFMQNVLRYFITLDHKLSAIDIEDTNGILTYFEPIVITRYDRDNSDLKRHSLFKRYSLYTNKYDMRTVETE